MKEREKGRSILTVLVYETVEVIKGQNISLFLLEHFKFIGCADKLRFGKAVF